LFSSWISTLTKETIHTKIFKDPATGIKARLKEEIKEQREE
jgi:hypothetical protein